MRIVELQEEYLNGKIEKKLYWRLMRENVFHTLPELQELLAKSKDCRRIEINKEGVILEKESGLKLYFVFSDSISRAEVDLLNGEDPELNEINAVSEMLGDDCKVILDIGANVGLFSLELYQKFKTADYYMFEPIPSTFSRMKKTLEINVIEADRFHPINKGMSNETGSFDFYLPGTCEAASLEPIDDVFYAQKADEFGNYTGKTDQDVVKCQVDTIDDFVANNRIDRVDFIKIDVEGNEKNVILGGAETIKKYHPVMYVELLRKHAKRFGYHPNEVVKYLKNIGYKCYSLENGEIREVDEIDSSTRATNFIFK